MNKVVKRDSNFELLRIVSMLFIIAHHLAHHGGYKFGQLFNLDNFILTFFISGGKLGVSLFVMITGYYMIKAKDIKISKLFGLELQVLFYSLGIFILFMLFSNRGFLIEELPKIFFPNMCKSYWFFSSYFILYLFIPFLNRLVSNINKDEYKRLLLIGFIFLILVPSVVISNVNLTEGIYLFYYYLVGGYIRLYNDDIKGNIGYLIGFILSYVAIVFITMYIGKLSYSNLGLLNHIMDYSWMDSLLLFVSSICLFLFFKGLNIGSNKIINVMAGTSFGIYLFHEHIFMKELLWDNIFNLDKLLNSNSILFTGIVIIVLVYIIGLVIDLIRQVIFKYFTKIIEKVGWNKLFN